MKIIPTLPVKYTQEGHEQVAIYPKLRKLLAISNISANAKKSVNFGRTAHRDRNVSTSFEVYGAMGALSNPYFEAHFS